MDVLSATVELFSIVYCLCTALFEFDHLRLAPQQVIRTPYKENHRYDNFE